MQPAIYGGLPFFSDPLYGGGRNGQAEGVGVRIQPQVVMRLAHPEQFRPFVDLDGVAPEFGEDLAFGRGQDAFGDRLPCLGQGVDAVLEFGFQQVVDEVVVVGAHQPDDDAAADFFIRGALQKILGQQQLVHRGRGFDKGQARARVAQALVFARQGEVSRVPQFVREGEDGAHAVFPGHKDVGVHAVHGVAISAGALAFVVGAVDPAFVEGAAHEGVVFVAEHFQCAECPLLRLLPGDFGFVLERGGEVAVEQVVEPHQALAEFLVAAHVGGEFGADDVEDVAVGVEGHFVRVEQHVLGGFVAAEFGEGDVFLDFGGKGRGVCIAVVAQAFRVGEVGFAAKGRVGGGHGAAIVDGVRAAVVVRDRLELHVRPFGKRVHAKRGVEDFAEPRDDGFRFRREGVRLGVQHGLQGVAVGGQLFILLQPLFDGAFGQGEHFGLDEVDAGRHIGKKGVGPRAVRLVGRVRALGGEAEVGVGGDAVQALFQVFFGIEAGFEQARAFSELALVVRDRLDVAPDRFHFGFPGVAGGEQVVEVPCFLNGDFGSDQTCHGGFSS